MVAFESMSIDDEKTPTSSEIERALAGMRPVTATELERATADRVMVERWAQALRAARELETVERPDADSVAAILSTAASSGMERPMMIALDVAAGLVHGPEAVRVLAAAYLWVLSAIGRYEQARDEMRSLPRPW